MSTFWAYAITDRAPATVIVGAAAAPLEHVELEDGIVLVGATIGNPPEPTLDALREHDRVTREIAPAVGAILPMRFGTRGAPEALAKSIRARALAVREGLASVEDAVQVTIRIAGGPPEEIAEHADAGPGTRFLRERARQRSPRLPGWEELARDARAIARAERIERGDPRTERVRVYHLIARGDLGRWTEAATRARDAAPDWAIAIGAPAPPWAFVPEEIA